MLPRCTRDHGRFAKHRWGPGPERTDGNDALECKRCHFVRVVVTLAGATRIIKRAYDNASNVAKRSPAWFGNVK